METKSVKLRNAGDIATRVGQLTPSLFAGIPAQQVEEILKAGKLRFYDANSIIITEGHSADEAMLLLDGRALRFATTAHGAKQAIMWVIPGNLVDGAAMLPTMVEYVLSTEAVLDSTVLVWTHDTIVALEKRFPRLIGNMMVITYENLIHYRNVHAAESYDLADKLVLVLRRLATKFGRHLDGGIEVSVRNEELASAVGSNVFTVSRLLSELQRQGVIVKVRGKIVIRSLDWLNGPSKVR
jgi:CRP/FNR family transcriptional regulator, nitrogen oxide reductase regulator